MVRCTSCGAAPPGPFVWFCFCAINKAGEYRLKWARRGYQMSVFFFSPVFFLVFHSLHGKKKKNVSGTERKNSNKVQSADCSLTALVLDWTAEVKLLVCGLSSGVFCRTMRWGRDRKYLIWMPKQVSGLWFHGFLGLSHVTFSAWSSSVLD